MQDRMQSRNRLVNLAASALVDPLFHLFLFAARTFRDRAQGHRIAEDVVGAFFALAPAYLKAIRENMGVVLGLPWDHPETERLARRMARNHAYAWVDFFFFGQRPAAEALDHFERLEGAEHLEHALRGGAILLTAHAGNYELGGLLLREKGIQIHTVYKPDRFAAVERLRNRVRAQGGVAGVPVDGVGFSTLPLLKLLRGGRVVGMQGDRDFNLTGLPLPFFGRQAYFPKGPWELAAMTGAPVIVSFFRSDAQRRFHATFYEPIHVGGGRGERQAAIAAGMARYVAILEDLVRRHPDQWYCFYPFWDDPLRKGLSAMAPAR